MLTSLEVNLDGVVDLDRRVGVSDTIEFYQLLRLPKLGPTSDRLFTEEILTCVRHA
jgi:hypothetical protein